MDIIVNFQNQETDKLIAKRKKRLEKAATWINKRRMETGIPKSDLVIAYYTRKRYFRCLWMSPVWLIVTGLIIWLACIIDMGGAYFNAGLIGSGTLLLSAFSTMPFMAEMTPFTQTEKADMDYLLRIINGV